MKKIFCLVCMIFLSVGIISCSSGSSENKQSYLPQEQNEINAFKKQINLKDINAVDVNGDTPLLFAVKNEKSDAVIDYLISQKANIEARDKNGYTSLMIAIRKHYNRPKLALALIKNGADVNAAFDKPYDKEDKMTPLMYAVSEYIYTRPEVIQALIDAGADVNAKNAEELTPLLIAAGDSRNFEHINILVKAGADIEARSKTGRTPLMNAIRLNGRCPEIAIALILNKANVNATYNKPYDKEDKMTPLMYATDKGAMTIKSTVLQALIDAGANVNAKNAEGNTPLLLASHYASDPENIEVLLKSGANIEERDKNGYTPLMISLWNGAFPDITLTLIRNKANVNAAGIDEKKRTALLIALDYYTAAPAKIIKALIESGANVNVKDADGKTALIYAAKNTDDERVKIIIDTNKVDLYAKDKAGKTAFDYAKINSRLKEKDLKKLK
ncbi:ankyrin repeat domain-containing protein [Endomicrobium proavitum]|uniref:Ankyrin, putative n=1 Tax=Endomicrobium proavitum TaxID=1408281 RepID=A0A0G3WJB1_9BACT|nr:ankyrin repeat domain-containing protein [Endomicrobium proavitum]AKL97569.1 ankyrin, putative [Endomicrobium proavitum]